MRSKRRPVCFLIACLCATVIRPVADHGRITAAEPQRLDMDDLRLRPFSDQGRVAGVPPPGTNVYRNEIDPITTFYAPGADERMADDLELAAGACDLVYYNLGVFGGGPAGTAYDVQTELWDDDPCAPGASVIPGTGAFFPDVSSGEGFLLEAFLDSSPVAIPGTVWLAATFSTSDAGWLAAERAEVGFTDDLFSEDDRVDGCDLFWFTGDPYAGFWANINCDVQTDPPGACCDGVVCTEVTEAQCTTGTWLGAFTTCDPNPCLPGACCTGFNFTTCEETTKAGCAVGAALFHPLATCAEDPCEPTFKVYENDFDTGFYDPVDTGATWADDLTLGPGAPCELAAYDITVVGAEDTPPFDVHVELWSNDDRDTPGDESDDIPAAPITGTRADFTAVQADQIAHTLLGGPFASVPLPQKVWMVFSLSSDQAGPLLGGMADIGFSGDVFVLSLDPNDPAAWETFFFGGFDPEGCPGDPPCTPAGSFHINVWCAGEPPTGACCNDAAATCVDGATRLHCDGRWVPGATCDSNPFDPPCGTNACCAQEGCVDVSLSDCEFLGGAVAAGSFCAGIECPRPVCIGASGDCFAANSTPGCEDAFCCEAVCAVDGPCCTFEWDGVCAGPDDAQRLCTSPPPPNDHCGNAEAITGEGVFDFDNSRATTDGPPHPAFRNVGGDGQIASDLWYCWTAPCSDTVYIRTCGLTEVDTKIAVYDRCETCPPADEALLASNDDLCGYDLEGLQTQVSFRATAGQSYLIRVGTFPGGGGYDRAAGGPGQFSITSGIPGDPACPARSDCCVGVETPGCADGTCCQRVCACDPYCCEVAWDADCAAIGAGNSGCGAEVLCSGLCAENDCPNEVIVWLDPPDGVVDARQPHPPTDAGQQQGIDTIVVSAPAGTEGIDCWTLCETIEGDCPNGVADVVDIGDGRLAIHLHRPISPGAVTTITYEGNGSTASLISHPGNANRDGLSNAGDVMSVLDCITGAGQCDQWQCDVDHSGRCAPPDVLRLIDLFNAAGEFDLWLNTPLPTADGTCP